MSYQYHRRVHFADTDAASVVHFSRLLCYVEEAEHALFAECGIPLMEKGGWPRVNIQCDYHVPLKLGDEVVISLSLEKLGNSSLLWAFSINLGDKQVATGKMKSVRVGSDGKPELIQQSWRDCLVKYEG